jgi:hypothetical protein
MRSGLGTSVILIFAGLIGNAAHAEPASHAVDLPEIIPAVREICGTVVQDGHSHRLTIEGNVAVAKAVSQIATGTASVTKEEYVVLVPNKVLDQVLEAIKGDVDCSVKLLQTLIKRLPPDKQPNTPGETLSSAITTGTEVIEDPGTFMADAIKMICFSHLGLVESTLAVKCRAGRLLGPIYLESLLFR